MAEKIIPIAKAARLLGLEYHTLLRLLHDKRIPSVRVCGVRRVRLSQVRAAIEEVGACA
jgi:excisionase family DNA binding protein